MEDIYKWYKTGILNYGSYTAYFNTSRPLQNSYSMKNKPENSPERYNTERSEGERKEQKQEVKQVELETKTETRADAAQSESKIENTQEQILEKPQQTSGIEKDSRGTLDTILTKYETTSELGQADINLNRRPSPYNDAEMRW